MADHIIPELDRKGLREFGFVTGGIVAVLFGLFFPWLLGRTIPVWPWVLCAVLIIIGLISPTALRPIYKIWMRFGLLMGRVMTPLIMSIVFFLVITPIGLLRRVFARDSLARKFEESESYRVPSEKAPTENLENPY